ncbi:penicillin acylase family protein [Planosporangium mesophilum]|uniref:Penicillin acylase n=1 Tax=Planosporangium mesophilum TaxID=689768 RepID=A0A8J3WZN2_9ACTN|nr:penicillin acylase family protein [Planosporangium mesophilum]NJC82684.1 penicillin acylase family protein [Planosporangium mesophilum]GII21831.1 penicillin acylase [Planosporangium mesophilum]
MRSRPDDRGLTHRLAVLTVASAMALAVVSVPGEPVGAAPAPTAPTAAAAPAAAAGDDYCLGQCGDILPPGQNGNATLADILAHKTLGTRPPHSGDQLDRYADLVYNYAGLTDGQIERFFNDASLGVPAGEVERTDRPRPDVTIVRDRATGTPHVTGTTRAGTMFGAGYAGAQDRLFTMDLLRHVGRGQLTPFAGGAPGNQALEQSVWRSSPYTEADLAAQVDHLRRQGSRGAQLYDDVTAYVAGVNRYITDCTASLSCPGEYTLTGHLEGPQPFTPTDLIATAGVVGGIFGGGGGAEMQSALVRVAARARYGTDEGDRVWAGFREQNDPETVLTLHNGQSFPYGAAPADTSGVALPDSGSAKPEPVAYDKSGSAGVSGGPAAAAGVLPGLRIGATHQGMSNAAVISAAKSATGHPIAVFGPQTGYFSPQLLMVQELRGPGIAARGAAFAGLNLYVLIGRGLDYSWSATSATQDITDTYALSLCEPDGSAPTVQSQHYLWHGQCTAMEVLERRNSWQPTLADGTAAGSYTLRTLRTNYGLVTWRGTVDGRPVAFTSLRSTYRHEADSAIGFQMFNEPAAMTSPAGFANAAAQIGYAFNWFFVNSKDSAYVNSGLNPVRSAVHDPNLPVRAEQRYEWQGFDPAANTATYQGAAQHPQGVNQDYFVSWNNKQAKDYSAADGNFSFGSVHRGDLLDARVRAALAGGGTLDRAGTLRLVEDAAVTDLRGEKVLGTLLRVLTSQPVTDPGAADAVAKLTAWRNAGAKRVETAPGSKVYRHADAIRIFDAWWPLLVSGQFKGDLGDGLYASLAGAMQINESPSGGQQGDAGGPSSVNEAQAHKGSSFQYGWWGYVDKDLRAVLGDPVSGPLPRRFCGNGAVSACRQTLLTTLGRAAAQPAAEVYPGDATCSAGDQWCADSIVHSPLGGITQPPIAWQNRPTYQQVVSYPAAQGSPVANLAAGRPVNASSTQLLFSTAAAVDSDRGTRWSSGWSDDQWIRVDLGGTQPVSRVVLRWEAAYAKGYRIEVSDDGGTWRPVWSTSAGDGGVDNDTFTATTARYVRMTGLKRATGYGYSLYEFEVYAR